MTLRACIACPNVYRGKLECPKCGEPGEPQAEPDWLQGLLDMPPPRRPMTHSELVDAIWEDIQRRKRITPHLRLVPDNDGDTE